jgi:hypothetical protein
MGEDSAGAENCPGEELCHLGFAEAAGATREEKEQNACWGCALFSSKPASFDKVENDEDGEIIADEIRDIVEWERGGFQTDWSKYPFEYKYLVKVWTDAVAEVVNRRAQRFDALVGGFLKAGDE